MNYIIEFLKLVYKYKDWIPKFSKKSIDKIDNVPELLKKYNGLNLKIDDALMKSAIEHANWMNSTGRVTHIGEYGKTHGYRISTNKYLGSYVAEYLIVSSGEDYNEAIKLLAKMIESVDQNIKFTKIGYGRKNKYWCFLLGK